MKKGKRKIKAPQPTVKIDLHGFTVQDAFNYCADELYFCEINGHKLVEVVTGKSGQIRKEFPIWLDTWGYTGIVAPHNGSFTVHLK
jgi:DNA-nicking Smr family endonuclease